MKEGPSNQKHWYQRPVWLLGLVATVVAVVTGVWGIQQMQRANRLAEKSANPQLSEVQTQTLLFEVPDTEGQQYLFCRTQVRLANTGGVTTSIIDVVPVGAVNEAGFLPEERFAVGTIGFDFKGFYTLIPPIPRLVPIVDFTVFEGPFPYQLAVIPAGEEGLLSLKAMGNSLEESSEGQEQAITSIDEFQRLVSQSPFFNRLLGVPDPQGLPFPLPPHSVVDLAIDFQAQFPAGVDLGNPRIQSMLERGGRALDLNYRLEFPDADAIEIDPGSCGSQALREDFDFEDLWEFYREISRSQP